MGGSSSKSGARPDARSTPATVASKPKRVIGESERGGSADESKTGGAVTLDELAALDKAYTEMAALSPGPTISKETFLERFPLPGLMGERLFEVIDRDNTGVIDKVNYLVAVRLLTKESLEGKIRLIFDMYDQDGSGSVSKDEMGKMLSTSASAAFDILCQFDPPKSDTEREERRAEMLAISNTMVDDAFETFDTNEDGKLSFEQFRQWAKNTPEVMNMLEAVIGHDGSAFTAPRVTA